MAIAFGSVGVPNWVVGVATPANDNLVLQLPSGTAKDDLLIAHISAQVPYASLIPAPDGWQLLDSQQNAETPTFVTHIFWKFATATETAATFVKAGTALKGGAITRWTGVPVRANPFNVTPTKLRGGGTSMVGPSITTLVPNQMVIWFYSQDDNGNITAAPNNAASQAYVGGTASSATNTFGTTSGGGSNLTANYKLVAAAGASGATTQPAVSGTQNMMITVAIDPTPSTTAPIVGAGADATVTAGNLFSRTATEDNGGATITARAWTIQSGPTGVGSTIGTAAALSWTPSTAGTYTLRYSATNSVGTGTDDVQVIVNPPAPVVGAGADATIASGATFNRTATETNSPTSRAWTIQSGPAGVGTTIGTAAALSWTPSTYGTYVLRYSATNAGGTGTDDVQVIVNPPAPTVGAGIDASSVNRTEFTRTATESGVSITARAWTIQSGPAGVGSTIGTAAALSWTPTVPGAYTLRYSATNVGGTGTDDVIVTVTAVVVSVAGSVTATSSVEGTPKLRVATKTLSNDPVATSSIVGTPRLTVATKTLADEPVATSSVVGTPRLLVATKTQTIDPVATSIIVGTPRLTVATKSVTDDPVALSSAVAALSVRTRVVMSGTAEGTASAEAVQLVGIRPLNADTAVISTSGYGFLRIPGSGYFHVESDATGNLSVIRTVTGAAEITSSATGAARRAGTAQATATAETSITGQVIGVVRAELDDVVAVVTAPPATIRATVPLYAEGMTAVSSINEDARLIGVQMMEGAANHDTSRIEYDRFLVVTGLRETAVAISAMSSPLRLVTSIAQDVTAQGSLSYIGGNLVRTRRMFIDPVTALSQILPPVIQRTVVYHPQVSATTTVPPTDALRVTKFYGYRLVGESEVRERSVKIVITTANIEGYVNRHNTRDVKIMAGYVTAVSEAYADLQWRMLTHRAIIRTSLEGNLVALKLYSEEIHAKSKITQKIRVTKMMSTVLAVMDDNGDFIPTQRPAAYDLNHAEETKPVVFNRTFSALR